jgi:hypothetical protein
MITDSLTHKASLLDLEESNTTALIKVILAYDGHAASEAAREVYRATTAALSQDFDFHETWLPFRVLDREYSTTERVEAFMPSDLLFLCPQNADALPEFVRHWVDFWIRQAAASDSALVLLLPESPRAGFKTTGLQEELGQMASAREVAFFSRQYSARNLRSSTVPNGLSVVGEHRDILRSPQSYPELRHWGINE